MSMRQGFRVQPVKIVWQGPAGGSHWFSSSRTNKIEKNETVAFSAVDLRERENGWIFELTVSILNSPERRWFYFSFVNIGAENPLSGESSRKQLSNSLPLAHQSFRLAGRSWELLTEHFQMHLSDHTSGLSFAQVPLFHICAISARSFITNGQALERREYSCVGVGGGGQRELYSFWNSRVAQGGAVFHRVVSSVCLGWARQNWSSRLA